MMLGAALPRSAAAVHRLRHVLHQCSGARRGYYDLYFQQAKKNGEQIRQHRYNEAKAAPTLRTMEADQAEGQQDDGEGRESKPC